MRNMQGDSGTWGSLKQMNATRNAKPQPRPTAAGNAMARGMLTGKYKAPNVFGKIKRQASKMFGL